MKNVSSVCISGHRPEKLPTGTMLLMMQSLLYHAIEESAEKGAETFYVGMARGTDLWAADMILHLRKRYPQLRLAAVLPYTDRLQWLNGAERFHVEAVLEAADEVVPMGKHYYKGCFRDRNHYMVTNSQRLIALVADFRSGTGQTIHMAKRAGLELCILSPEMAKQQSVPAHEFLRFEV